MKNSFVDWPAKIASVIFLGGCNFNCFYCHNHHILSGMSNAIPLDGILKDIEKRIGFIDGVVISGGEPTVHPNLREIIDAVRAFGLPVKLDTNGTNCDMLMELVEGGLVDYVAMDIKAPLEKYRDIVGVDVGTDEIRQSIEYLKSQNRIPFMFRTTPAPCLTDDDIAQIRELAGNATFRINDYVEQ